MAPEETPTNERRNSLSISEVYADALLKISNLTRELEQTKKSRNLFAGLFVATAILAGVAIFVF